MNYKNQLVRTVTFCLLGLFFAFSSCKKDEGGAKEEEESVKPNWAVVGGDAAWSEWGDVSDMELINDDLYVAFSSGASKLTAPLYVSKSGGNWQLVDSGTGVLRRSIEQGHNGHLYMIDELFDKYAGYDRYRYVFKKLVNDDFQILDTVYYTRPDMPPGSGINLNLNLIFVNNNLMVSSGGRDFWRITLSDSVEQDPTLMEWWLGGSAARLSHTDGNKAYFVSGTGSQDPYLGKESYRYKMMSYDGSTLETEGEYEWELYNAGIISCWNYGMSFYKVALGDDKKRRLIENFETKQKVYEAPEEYIISSLSHHYQSNLNPVANREVVLTLNESVYGFPTGIGKVKKLLFHGGNSNFTEVDWKLPSVAGVTSQDNDMPPLIVLKKNGSLYSVFGKQAGRFYVVKNLF